MRIFGPHSPQKTPVGGTEGTSSAKPKTQASAGSPPAPAAQEGPSASSLWDQLTPEEQAFVTQKAKTTRITYRPDGLPVDSIPAPTGQRVDVRG
jgi:hypothetical protein